MMSRLSFLLLLFIVSFCSVVESSSNTKIENYSPLKLVYMQSDETYKKFTDIFTRQIVGKKVTSDEMKKDVLDNLSATVGDESVAFLKASGTTGNSQVPIGKLAFMYEALNRADLAAAISLNQICESDGLAIPKKKDSDACSTYSPYLLKLIESRISVITSRIIFSDGILGIPKGWINHVQEIIKELKQEGLLSDSLVYLLIILRGVSQNNEEINTTILPNLLAPKTVSNNTVASTQIIPVAAPTSAKITIDARNLVKEIRNQQMINESHVSEQEQQPKLDPILAQLLPKMMMI